MKSHSTPSNPISFCSQVGFFGCLEKNHPNPPASGMPSRSYEDPVPAQFVQLRALRTDHQFFVPWPWPGQIYELMSWDAQRELGGFICLDLMKVFSWCFFPGRPLLGESIKGRSTTSWVFLKPRPICTHTQSIYIYIILNYQTSYLVVKYKPTNITGGAPACNYVDWCGGFGCLTCLFDTKGMVEMTAALQQLYS